MPLILKDLYIRVIAQEKEYNAAGGTGNANKLKMVQEELLVEQKSWYGKPVKDVGEVIQVTRDSTVILLIYKDSKNSRRWAECKAKDKNDPLLKTLVRGNIVEVEGVFLTTGSAFGALLFGPFEVKDCVFNLKK